MKRITFLGLLVWNAIAAWGAEPVEAVPADIKDAIVKIFVIQNSPDYYNPWSMRGSQSGTGSGCIISGRRILTNGHVVGDQTFIQVRRHGQARKYTARVLSVSHEADLALLTVDDPEFFEGVEPLEFGELPQAQQEVLVFGFPLGGDMLSITRGVVSRIEHRTYVHSSCFFLAGQIDAAINAGNSGGPVVVDGRIVGVVMQGIPQAENIGYMVPTPVIRHFLEDLTDGRYDGFPSLGVVMQTLENPDLKRRYGLDVRRTGMLVVKVIPGSPAARHLRRGDILLSIQGHPIADDGTVEFRPKERTSVAYYIQERQIGEPIDLEVFREGRVERLRVVLDRPLQSDWLIPMEQYDCLPRYFIYGGVVFSPLTKNFLQAWGPNWYNNAPKELVALLSDNFVTEERDELVVVLKVLAADVNEGYHDIANWIVESVNGVPVRNLRHLVELVEQSHGEFVEFTNDRGEILILDRAKAARTAEEILARYRIPRDRSEDLLPPVSSGPSPQAL